MMRKEQDNKLQSGLQAYAVSVEASGALTGFRQRLGKWPVYAAAAGSALAFSTSATANTIVYSGPLNTGSANIDGNSFGVFVTGMVPNLTSLGLRPTSSCFVCAAAANVRGNGSMLFGLPFRPYNFGAGFSVTSRRGFQPAGGLLDFFNGGIHDGYWSRGGAGYAAIRLPNGDLGWIKIAVGTEFGYPTSAAILSWAYNDVPGASILTGETANTTASTPEPNSLALALLATGAAGVLAFRRRRKAAASQAAGSAQ
jgi:hypothetical protein